MQSLQGPSKGEMLVEGQRPGAAGRQALAASHSKGSTGNTPRWSVTGVDRLLFALSRITNKIVKEKGEAPEKESWECSGQV